MKIGKSPRSADSAPIVGPQTDITKENYFERARAFVGSKGGVGFVVRGIEGIKGSAQSRQFATDPQWLAWMHYFERLGYPTGFMRFNGEATVPCEWPEDFDATCGPSNRAARIYVAPKAVDFDRKLTVERVEKRFLDWGAKPKRKDHPGTTEDWLRSYGSQPLSVSDALRAKMEGMGDEPTNNRRDNHDFGHYVTENPLEFAKLFYRAIASGSPESWEQLEHYGFHRIVQVHHSDERKVVTKYREYPLDRRRRRRRRHARAPRHPFLPSISHMPIRMRRRAARAEAAFLGGEGNRA